MARVNRDPTLKNLVTMREISERLGVPRGTLDVWAYKREYMGFPAPTVAGSKGQTNLFDWREIEKWCVVHRPELLLDPDERKREEAATKRRQEHMKRLNKFYDKFKPLHKVTKAEVGKLAKEWREQELGMTDFLNKRLFEEGYRWHKEKDKDAFDTVKRRVIAATRKYGKKL